jgi:acyl-CoA oxidase
MAFGIVAAVIAAVLFVYRFLFGGSSKSNIFTAFPAESNDPFLAAWKRVALRHKSLTTYAESEAALRDAMKELGAVLKAKELIRTSGSTKLFVGHREGGALFEVGLGIRTTVQFNLFGGSVANLGSPEQVDWLQGVFDRGEIGCFALTEERAGVLSGLIVDTTATATASGEFILSSSAAGSTKRWISNGYGERFDFYFFFNFSSFSLASLVARWAVVVARLILKNGEDKGPHAFVCDLTLPGVKREDMPKKVAFNGLDNATIAFHDVRLPKSALLSGISYLNDEGIYCLRVPGRPFSFLAVAQRLLSGRICIAGAALSTIR